MKSLIEFPEKVVTSSELLETSCQANNGVDGLAYSDDESDQSVSSTSSESESDSVNSESDCDENDIADDILDVNKNNTLSKTRRSVSFGPIHVRQYERIVGDHPETKVGVPLALGWAYYEDEQHPDGVSIERYEADKIPRTKMRLSSITRRNMMLNVFGLDEEEIRQAENRSTKRQIQKNRLGRTSQSPLKKFGKKMKKGGMSILKGMSQVGQLGSASSFLSAVDHAF